MGEAGRSEEPVVTVELVKKIVRAAARLSRKLFR
jgi:hypothetical protein